MWAEIIFYNCFSIQSIKPFQYKRYIQKACLIDRIGSVIYMHYAKSILSQGCDEKDLSANVHPFSYKPDLILSSKTDFYLIENMYLSISCKKWPPTLFQFSEFRPCFHRVYFLYRKTFKPFYWKIPQLIQISMGKLILVLLFFFLLWILYPYTMGFF